MDEQGFIDALHRLRKPAVTHETLRLADAAVEAFPHSCALWCLRGDLIQLSDGESGHELADALVSYRRAAELDPLDPEPHESIGFFLDVVEAAPAEAEPHFRRAIALGAGVDSYLGFAEVLVELRRRDEARRLLEASPFRFEPPVVALLADLSR